MTPRIRRLPGSGPDTVRRVISEETARTVRSFLEGVVQHGTGTRAAVPGYRVAGKTGSAQRAYDDRPGYDPERYVTSFVGFLPAERAELLCLVVVDGPKGTHLASRVAAPVFSRIVRRVVSLPNTGMRHRAVRFAAAEEKAPAPPRTPVLAGLKEGPALRALARNGLSLRDVAEPEREVPVLRPAGRFEGGTRRPVAVPNVVGVPLRQAVVQLTRAGLRVKATGSGVVVRQMPVSGARIRRGSLTRVTCRTSG